MCAKYLIAAHPRVVETFHSRPQMGISWWRSRKSQGIAKVIRIHPLWSRYACTKFNGNEIHPIDISVWAKVVDRPTG